MTTLHQHIQGQQDRAMHLCGILEALSVLDNEGSTPQAVTSLLAVARNIAEERNEGLDTVNLPRVPT